MGNILVIGSLAFNGVVGAMGRDDLRREPKDHDYIASFDDALQILKSANCHTINPASNGDKLIGFTRTGKADFPIEVEIAWEGSTGRKLLDYCFSATGDDSRIRFAPLDVLYALKMSHRYKRNSPHFHKTMADIHAMRGLGAAIPESLRGWFKERESETYAYKHPNLNTTKKAFFGGDGIDYVYDHDSIHLAIKEFEQPAYNFFKPDTKEVFCSKKMFFNCSEAVRLFAVYEESCVLAVERSLVPHPNALTPPRAFDIALSKVCTSITSGWFREYAWENHGAVTEIAQSRFGTKLDYFTLFQNGLKNGVVKPFKKE